MKHYIKQFIIVALMLVGNITAWAETKTITYSMHQEPIPNTLSQYIYSLDGDNGEKHEFGTPEGGNLANPLVMQFQDVTITVTSTDTYCHIGYLTIDGYGFYGHGYAFKVESANYYVTHVTVRGQSAMTYKTAEANNNSKSCTVNFPEDNVVIKNIIVTLTDKLDIANATVSGINDSYDYTGSAITPSPTVALTTGVPTPVSLTEGTDYTVNYVSNTEVGTATIILTGIGEYTGSWSKTFAINKAAPTLTAPTASTLTYNGAAQALCSTGSVTGGTLEYSTDETTWSEDVPTATYVGSSPVYYRVIADQNHTDIASTSAGTASINARQRTFGTVSVTDGHEDVASNTLVISDGTDDVTIAEDVNIGSITLQRTFTVGKTATVMLPFDIDVAKVSGGAFYGFVGVDKLGATGWEVVMSPVSGTLQAHTPYLFMPSDEHMTFNLGGQTVTLKANSEQTYTVKP